MPKAPAVREHMTATPVTVAPSTPMADAAAIMESKHIRHLPVADADGGVIGLLSERDVALLEGIEGIDSGSLMVAVAMSKQPYTASPDTPLDEVARHMADRKLGSCVIVENAKIVGVFTTVDACRALADSYDD